MFRSLLLWTLLLGAAATVSCSGDNPSPPACPREQATFRVQLTTESGVPVPSDTVITVEYQGSQRETFAVRNPGASNEDVCCRLADPVTAGRLPNVPCGVRPGRDAAPAEGALQCELWTNGVAEFHASARGYVELHEILEAEARDDECGLRTMDVRLVLARHDGG